MTRQQLFPLAPQHLSGGGSGGGGQLTAPAAARYAPFFSSPAAAALASRTSSGGGRQQQLASSPAAAVDYVSLADPESLQELDQAAETALASLAVRFGRTRLIDNLLLGPAAPAADAKALQGA